MCRLFGLHAGATAVAATFWLLDAADSLSAQSRRNPDGAGIGVFGADGTPTVEKQPMAAWQDTQFAAAANRLRGTTFVAHVRHASIGANVMADTHPFLQDGRLFAHNGIVQGLSELDRRLAELDAVRMVHGDTDSERIFALITVETSRHGGDVGAGLAAAISWVSENLPIYALNLVMSTATDLWALRYPATHELYLLQRPAGGTGTNRDLDARSDLVHVRSAHLARQESVLVASERMDDDPGWRLLEPGELLHVNADLGVDTSRPFASTPHHLLRVSQLDAAAAASQHPELARYE
jgi:predicted glutamine amidotransferase